MSKKPVVKKPVPKQPDFQLASERLELVPNAIGLGIASGRLPLDLTFGLLRSLAIDDLRHGRLIESKLPTLRAHSDAPIKWEHGRGWSGVAAVPGAVHPHCWSTAHEAALSLEGMALDLFWWLNEVTYDKDPRVPPTCNVRLRFAPDLEPTASGLPHFADLNKKQQAAFGKLLSDRSRKALAMTADEVVDWEERIRRERAKVLAASAAAAADTPPPDGPVWLGDGRFIYDGVTKTMKDAELAVTNALIKYGPLTKPDLETKSQVPSAASVFHNLAKKWPAAYHKPGRRNQGGYSHRFRQEAAEKAS